MCIRDSGMLVDVEYSNRKNNRLKRLSRQAGFEQPDVSIAAIDFDAVEIKISFHTSNC